MVGDKREKKYGDNVEPKCFIIVDQNKSLNWKSKLSYNQLTAISVQV